MDLINSIFLGQIDMLTFEQSKVMVEQKLTEKNSKYTLVISMFKEHEFGWVFHWNTKEYVETGNVLFKLFGSSPYIVDKDKELIHPTGTAKSIEYYVKEYMTNKRKPVWLDPVKPC